MVFLATGALNCAIVRRLASAGAYVQHESEEPPERLAPDNVPVNDSWNTLRVMRDGDNLQVLLNDKPLTTVAMERNARFGIVRPFERDVRIQSITLTGDWPTELPEDLMEPVSAAGP